MWGYRLEHAPSFGLLSSVETVRKKLATDPQRTVVEFEQDIEKAKNMARALGWDTSMVEPIKCFIVPGPDSFMVGFVIEQATSSQRYVLSPAPLAFLMEKIDWDAHTSEEEMRKALQALSGQQTTLPPLKVGEWQRSRKGNYYTSINGALCTVFPSKNGGFCAIVSAPHGDRKVFTQAFQTELECLQYVVANFYEIIREWGISPTGPVADDDPFGGIDWGPDDIPF